MTKYSIAIFIKDFGLPAIANGPPVFPDDIQKEAEAFIEDDIGPDLLLIVTTDDSGKQSLQRYDNNDEYKVRVERDWVDDEG
jgi:hypothetical protein